MAQNITSGVTGDRQFIEIKSYDESAEFWVDFGATAVVSASRPCKGYFYMEIPTSIVLSVIASEAADLSIVEGGMQ